jgi:hypothetical protein
LFATRRIGAGIRTGRRKVARVALRPRDHFALVLVAIIFRFYRAAFFSYLAHFAPIYYVILRVSDINIPGVKKTVCGTTEQECSGDKSE